MLQKKNVYRNLYTLVCKIILHVQPAYCMNAIFIDFN